MIARDWLQTLWRTSYKGAAFWVETDSERGSRRLVVHEFPNRDFPFVEDIGEGFREFTVTAYIANDRADTEGNALMNVCATRGAGILVLPTRGPVMVLCGDFTRNHDKDKLGYVAFSLKFIREGFSSALATVASLVNMIFINAETAAATAAASYAATASIKNVPDYVQQSLQTNTEGALASLEAVRTSNIVEPTANAKQRDAIAAAYKDLPEVLANEDVEALEVIGKTITDVSLALVENMSANSGLSAMAGIIDATPYQTLPRASSTSKWRDLEASNSQAPNTLLRIAAIIAYCEAIAAVKLSDRKSAITLRANVSNYFEEQLLELPSSEYALYGAMIKLRDATVDYLSRSIIDLAPVVRVIANAEMPSLFWAWRLYKDPNRSTELVERNRISHPSFMPTVFEALGK